MSAITRGIEGLGFNADWVDALPTALMKPLSGSGARGMMIDTMKTFGADSFAGRLACTFQGATDTTFLYHCCLFRGGGDPEYPLRCSVWTDCRFSRDYRCGRDRLFVFCLKIFLVQKICI